MQKYVHTDDLSGRKYEPHFRQTISIATQTVALAELQRDNASNKQ